MVTTDHDLAARCAHLAAVCALCAVLAGCESLSQVAGVRATDLSGIQVGAPRVEVEKALGDPVGTFVREERTWQKYHYNTGVKSRPLAVLAAPIELVYPAAWICHLESECKMRSEKDFEKNRRSIHILYDSGERVELFEADMAP